MEYNYKCSLLTRLIKMHIMPITFNALIIVGSPYYLLCLYIGKY